jgi:hypothetical protein
MERYERVRVEFSRKAVGCDLLSIVASTFGVCGMRASLRTRQDCGPEMEYVAQLGVKLGRKGINNRIKQAKDLIREIK